MERRGAARVGEQAGTAAVLATNMRTIEAAAWLACGAAAALILRYRSSTAVRSRVPRRRTSKKLRVGILGGSGPEAGADLLLKVIHENRNALGAAYLTDRDGPDVVLISCSGIGGPRGPDDVVPGSPHYERSWVALSEAVLELAPMVDRFVVACNTLHMFEAQVRELLARHGYEASMLVSMVAATSAHCRALGLNSLAIWGGPVTCDLRGLSAYRPMAEALGDAIVPPSDEQRDRLYGIIRGVKRDGPTEKAAREFGCASP